MALHLGLARAMYYALTQPCYNTYVVKLQGDMKRGGEHCSGHILHIPCNI